MRKIIFYVIATALSYFAFSMAYGFAGLGRIDLDGKPPLWLTVVLVAIFASLWIYTIIKIYKTEWKSSK